MAKIETTTLASSTSETVDVISVKEGGIAPLLAKVYSKAKIDQIVGALQGRDIIAVLNYAALPAASTVSDKFYFCRESQGTSWLPGSVGGTYYAAGVYYSNGVTWDYTTTAYQATQAEVDAGIVANKFVAPDSLKNAAQWLSHTHKGGTINPDNILIDKSYTDSEASALAVGTLFYNGGQQDWMLKTSTDTYYNFGGEVSPLMKNGDSFTHVNGTPVYIYTGAGKLPVVKVASASSEATSYTIALATQDVVNTGNARGRYCAFGTVGGVAISGVIKSGESSALWVEGASLYLSTEAGKLTTVRPVAPNHGVRVGYITDKSGSNVSIFASVDVGSELAELHDVDLTKTKTTPIYNDSLLLQDSEDSSIWKRISWANIKSTLKAYFDSYYQSQLVLSLEKTSSFTLALTDLDAMLGCNHATVAIVVTVPPNSSVAVPIGKSVYIRRKGAAAVSIAAGAGVTINSENSYLNLNAQYSVAQLLKVDTDTWALFGSLKA